MASTQAGKEYVSAAINSEMNDVWLAATGQRWEVVETWKQKKNWKKVEECCIINLQCYFANVRFEIFDKIKR
jgi:hypothetical protein